MKKMLIITGIALSVATSAFAQSRAQQAAEAASKVKERATGTRVETTGSKVETNANVRTDARGSRTIVEDSAAAVEAAQFEAAQAGAQCDPKENLSATKMSEQAILKDAADHGLITSANCFVAGSITDDVARMNGIGTVADGLATAKKEGATTKVKAFALNASKKAKIAASMLAGFATRTGRDAKDALTKQDYKEVCSKCFGAADAAFCSVN